MDQTAFKLVLGLDPFCSNTLKAYRTVLYIISKDPSSFTSSPHHANVDMDAVLNFRVPLHPMTEK